MLGKHFSSKLSHPQSSETRFYYIAQAGLEDSVLLPPKCCLDRFAPTYPVNATVLDISW